MFKSNLILPHTCGEEITLNVVNFWIGLTFKHIVKQISVFRAMYTLEMLCYKEV